MRRLGWPAAMLTLIGLTGLSLYLVATNMLLLLAGWRALPSAQVELDLGTTSLSTLGVLGVVIEVLIIGYFLVSSIVGLYSLPPLKKILPVKGLERYIFVDNTIDLIHLQRHLYDPPDLQLCPLRDSLLCASSSRESSR